MGWGGGDVRKKKAINMETKRLPKWYSGKNLLANAGDTGDVGLILASGRSPGEGNGNPLQYSCLENSIDKGAWWPTSMGSQRVRRD